MEQSSSLLLGRHVQIPFVCPVTGSIELELAYCTNLQLQL